MRLGNFLTNGDKAARSFVTPERIGTLGYTRATFAGSRVLQASSARRTFCIALSRVNGGRWGRVGVVGVALITVLRTSGTFPPRSVRQLIGFPDCASPRNREPLAYLAGREPAMRMSTSLLALCCQSGLVATLATPISARSRSIASRSLRMSPLLIARFTSARIASHIRS